ncbi:precorrin-6A reductase [Vibrio salinus]|uniref:precorrin-6A reductase n=1 Tax=Vibrio salinus TaxID=2899784 RepID=UPI001E633400|nr:precorrin-6A reductase [Vibrio salinus]MCE0495671.1 precorrin-6A reductase [Vibrio salinus]
MTPVKVCVFGGTSTSLDVCEWLNAHSIEFCLCVATHSGLESASAYEQNVRVGRMDEKAMADWVRQEAISLIIDAAHPYARVLHETIRHVAQKEAIPVVRYDRPPVATSCSQHPFFHPVRNPSEACQKLAELNAGRVLLTTGSKDLNTFRHLLPDVKLFARVLPNVAAMEQCAREGFLLDEIIALKGPFSAEFNRSLYRELNIDSVVTKESGSAGGFYEKVQPCLDMKRHCVVITRPETVTDDYVAVIYECSALEPILVNDLNG